MNIKVDPCEDFYQYTCGGWLDKVNLPEGYARWGSFAELDVANKQILKKVSETLYLADISMQMKSCFFFFLQESTMFVGESKT